MEKYRRSYQFHRLLKVQDLENQCNSKLKVLEDTCPQSLGKTISNLWNDPGVQQVYGLAHQFQLNETAKYVYAILSISLSLTKVFFHLEHNYIMILSSQEISFAYIFIVFTIHF